MGRRGESVFKRKDGRWEARYALGKDNNGTVKYRSVYGKTYTEAKEKRKSAMQQEIAPKSENSFSDVITRWMLWKEADVKTSTMQKYRQCIDTHIQPFFGKTRCSAITPDMIEDFMNQKRKSGRLDGNGGLSQNTIRDMGALLQSLLLYANDKKMGVNAAIHVKKPKPEKKAICVLKGYEQRSMDALLLSNPHNSNLAIYLALHTGLRIGEVCALRWGDIDFVEKQLRVSATITRDSSGALMIGAPKSESSTRSIPITDKLAQLLLKEREGSSSEFIFTSPKTRTFLNPRTLQHRFGVFLKKHQFSKITFHALRHTFATRWIECGMDIKSLSEVLGHTSVQITLDLYVHSSDKLKRDAIEQIELISGQGSGQQEAGSVA